MIIGFVYIQIQLRKLKEDFKYAANYKHTFVELTNKWRSKDELDNEKYVWLTMNANKIQSIIGGFGIIDYIAPMQTYTIPNYHVILNNLPRFRDGKISNFEINTTDDCLLRYLGHVKNNIDSILKKIKNPLYWFKEGIKLIIGSPFLLLAWFEIINQNTLNRILSNFLYNVITGIISLFTFLSSIITIIIGKDEFLKYIHDFFN